MNQGTKHITIRPYQTSDRDVILKIYKNASKEAHGKFLNKEQLKQEYKYIQDSLDNLVGLEVFVIERYGKIAGFASFISSEKMSGIFIKTDQQKKRLGSCLLNSLKQNKARINLVVYTQNYRAIDFYHKHGFIRTEPQKNSNGHEYIEMTWEREVEAEEK